MAESEVVLDIQGLKTYLNTDDGVVKAVDDISFKIGRNEIVGVVGESGCGKSMTGFSVLNIIPRPVAHFAGGNIMFRNGGSEIDITQLDPKGSQMRSLRGSEIAMIFQEPMACFNPTFRMGSQLREPLRVHRRMKAKDAEEHIIELLANVGISRPRDVANSYPHQLSGGMRQRAMIAMALSCDPKLLIADEPTTALDVTVEAQILELIKSIQSDHDMSVMFISHDLDVIGELCDRVLVMYAGKIVEESNADDLYYRPSHPYTQGLMKSVPKIGNRKRIEAIEGSVPNLLNMPNGCYFADRCPHAMDICYRKMPPDFAIGSGHSAKCWLHSEDQAAFTSKEEEPS